MASEMMDALSALAREKHIDELHLLTCLEDALAETYTEILELEYGYGVRVTIDRKTGNIYVYELIPKGEPDEETGEYEEFDEKDITPEDTSRIAAHTAKKVIARLVREAGQEQIYEEFAERIGDVITGTVLQSTPNFTIVKIRDGVEAELPHYDQDRFEHELNEQPKGERYTHNQRLKALIIDVRDPQDEKNRAGDRSRPTIVISRTHPDLVKRLFELEVPEVYDGIVEIKSVTREPGVRSKIAVSSLDPRLDPVGACVGPKGSRVRMVVSELRGERVDVIQWSENPGAYVANALSPAKVSNVLVDVENQYATVVVPDDQLSLAIGKEGQNARLAARLTGWHIDIKSASLASEMLSADMLLFDEESQDENAEICEYIDANGIRCRNHKRPGQLFCGVHAETDPKENAERARNALVDAITDQYDSTDDFDTDIEDFSKNFNFEDGFGDNPTIDDDSLI